MLKKVYLAAALSLLYCKPVSAVNDSLFKKKTLRKTSVEMLFGHYSQNGQNSAVTGGIGTEKLSIYAPGFTITTSKKSLAIKLKTGADIITSASTDNIDYVQSSASRHDVRSYANLSLTKTLSKQHSIELGTGFSMESDYFSLPVILAFKGKSKNAMREWLIESKSYFDDLRWGRLNSNYKRPIKLIYPVELRNRDWFETNKRQSFNLKIGLSQIVNKRNIIGIYPMITLQKGLLATPFHRVVFNNSETRVENLPDQRLKFALSAKWNCFIGAKFILKNTLESYVDDFGIKALAFENETAIKLKNGLILAPFVRLYRQSAAQYFAPYAMHSPDQIFYCSDYDLSKFQSLKTGLEIKLNQQFQLNKHLKLHQIQLRYAYFKRSNGLFAHSLTFNAAFEQLH